MKISADKTCAVFDRYNIVNETDIRNAYELVAKVHEEMRETVELGKGWGWRVELY